MEHENQDMEQDDQWMYDLLKIDPLTKRRNLERQERYLTKIGVTQDNFAEKMLEFVDRNDMETAFYIMVKYILPLNWYDLPQEKRDNCKTRGQANAEGATPEREGATPVQLSEAQQSLLADAEVTQDNFHQKAIRTLEYYDHNTELLRAIIIKYILPLQPRK